MKKKEIIFLAVIAVISLAALFFLKGPFKKEEEPKVQVGIYHGEKLVYTFDPQKDAVIHVQGSYGTLDVEVKDGSWHVVNEECPNHICHNMGWMTVDDFLPITCLPNEVYIMVLDPQ